jgi:hypothetical protein
MQLRPVTWLDMNVNVEMGWGNDLTLEELLKKVDLDCFF